MCIGTDVDRKVWSDTAIGVYTIFIIINYCTYLLQWNAHACIEVVPYCKTTNFSVLLNLAIISD